MRRRSRAYSTGLTVCAPLLAAVVACATAESDLASDVPAEGRVPPSESRGLDAASTETGAETDTCAPDALCPSGPFGPNGGGQDIDERTRIHVIHGRSTTDVWAAGAHGVVVRFDGTEWVQSNTDTIETLRALWLRSPGEVAFSSLVQLYTREMGARDAGDPASPGGWTAVRDISGTAESARSRKQITSSWAAPGADWLWCTTLESTSSTANGLWRIRLDASTNTFRIDTMPSPGTCTVLPCRQMTSVHGSSANDLWAVGHRGATVHIEDAQSDEPHLAAFNSQTWAPLYGVWAAAEDDVWAVGGSGTIRHYTGHPTSWDIVSDVPTTAHLRAVWGSGPSDIWAVGDGAVVLHYDGNVWSLVKVAGLGGRQPDLYTVWAPAPGHVWAAGDGVILSLGGKP